MVCVLLGLLALGIARCQADTARDKLKLDQYDRRYAVFRSLYDFTHEARGGIVPLEQVGEYMLALEPARFLFDAEFNEWLAKVVGKLMETNGYRERYADGLRAATRDSCEQDGKTYVEPPESAPPSEAERHDDRKMQALIGPNEATVKAFAPYLGFRKNL